MITNAFTMNSRWQVRDTALVADDGFTNFRAYSKAGGFELHLFDSEGGNPVNSFMFPTWKQLSVFCATYSGNVQDHAWYRNPAEGYTAPSSAWTFRGRKEMWTTGGAAVTCCITMRVDLFWPSMSGAVLKQEWEGSPVLTWEEAAVDCHIQLQKALGLEAGPPDATWLIQP